MRTVILFILLAVLLALPAQAMAAPIAPAPCTGASFQLVDSWQAGDNAVLVYHAQAGDAALYDIALAIGDYQVDRVSHSGDVVDVGRARAIVWDDYAVAPWASAELYVWIRGPVRIADTVVIAKSGNATCRFVTGGPR